MSFNWYAQEELAHERRVDDLRAAAHSRLVKEALEQFRSAGLMDRVMNALGAFMVRTGSWLVKQASLRETLNSLSEQPEDQSRACATC